MTKTATHNLYRQIAFTALAGTLALLMLTYGYLLNLTISSGVAIERGGETLAKVNARVGTLEEGYFKAKSGVTLSLAQSLDFKDVGNNVLYISRAAELPRGLSLSTR